MSSQTERDDLLRAIEAHMAEMDMRALKPGRHRDDIDNDLYNVATRIREASGPAPDQPTKQTYTREQLLSEPIIEVAESTYLEIRDRQIDDEEMLEKYGDGSFGQIMFEAALAAIDKGKGGEDG